MCLVIKRGRRTNIACLIYDRSIKHIAWHFAVFNQVFFNPDFNYNVNVILIVGLNYCLSKITNWISLWFVRDTLFYIVKCVFFLYGDYHGRGLAIYFMVNRRHLYIWTYHIGGCYFLAGKIANFFLGCPKLFEKNNHHFNIMCVKVMVILLVSTR